MTLTLLPKERAILRETDFGEPLVRFRELSIASGPGGEHQQLPQGEDHGESQEHPGQHRRPSCHCPWSASTTRKRNVENRANWSVAIFARDDLTDLRAIPSSATDGRISRAPRYVKTDRLRGGGWLEVRYAAMFVNKARGRRPISWSPPIRLSRSRGKSAYHIFAGSRSRAARGLR